MVFLTLLFRLDNATYNAPFKAFSILDASVCMYSMLAARINKQQANFQIIATQIMLPDGKYVVCV
jgi:hypothetical protein